MGQDQLVGRGWEGWREGYITIAVHYNECCPAKLVPGVVVLGNVSREDRVESLHDGSINCQIATAQHERV